MSSLTFKQIWNEVKESVPDLSPFLAQRFVNRALREIYRARNWSFLTESDYLSFPASVSSGSVTLTQFSKVVVPGATARTAWGAMGLTIPITQRIFRVAGGQVYTIAEHDPAGTSTSWNTGGDLGAILLGEAYQGSTAAGSSYQIYRAYVSAPSTDFLRWVSVVDPTSNTTIDPYATREQIDALDPQRTESGTPRCLATFKGDSDGDPLFEVHPHVTTSRSLSVTYLRRGRDLSGTDTAPRVIEDELIMARALSQACRWADRNKGKNKVLQATNWLQAAREHDAEYERILQRTKRQDEEAFPMNVVSAGAGFRPSDEYARTHILRR